MLLSGVAALAACSAISAPSRASPQQAAAAPSVSITAGGSTAPGGGTTVVRVVTPGTPPLPAPAALLPFPGTPAYP